MKEVLFFSLKVGISLSLLIYLFGMIDADHFLNLFASAHFPLVLSAGLLYLGCQYLAAYRWQTLLRAQEMAPSLPRLFSFYLIGMFFNNFVPLGTDTVRGYKLYRLSGKGQMSVVTTFLDRYTGLVALVAIGFASWGIGYSYFSDSATTVLISGMVGFLIIGTLIGVNRSLKTALEHILRKNGLTKFESRVTEFYNVFGKYRNHKKLFLSAIGLSFVIQFLNIAVYLILAEALRIDVPWGYFFLFFPIFTAIAMLPISLNGIGVRDGMVIYLFQKAGVPQAQALGLSLTWFFVVTGISLLGGILFVLQKRVDSR